MGDPQTIGTMRRMVAVHENVLKELVVAAIAFEMSGNTGILSVPQIWETRNAAVRFVDGCEGNELAAWEAHLEQQQS